MPVNEIAVPGGIQSRKIPKNRREEVQRIISEIFGGERGARIEHGLTRLGEPSADIVRSRQQRIRPPVVLLREEVWPVAPYEIHHVQHGLRICTDLQIPHDPPRVGLLENLPEAVHCRAYLHGILSTEKHGNLLLPSKPFIHRGIFPAHLILRKKRSDVLVPSQPRYPQHAQPHGDQ